MSIWLNGHLYSDAIGKIDGRDRGLLLADGIFETLLVRHGRPVFFKQHLSRLKRAANFFTIPINYSDDVIGEAIRQSAERFSADDVDCAARLTLTRGVGQRGLVPPHKRDTSPTFMVSAAPVLPPSPDSVQLIVSDICRNEGSPSSGFKTISYTDNILARHQAVQNVADDAVMCNNAGHLACATAANLFLLLPDLSLVTPDRECGILPGITRDVLLSIASELSLPVDEGKYKPAILENGCIFLTNSLVGIQRAQLVGSKVRMSEDMENLLLELQRQYAQKVSTDIGL
ncbi:aminotransferase class IV [Parvularcula sp. IMCC14364]|uniref:aminotransferase class IV n=1 Tax=Parvularcula sp. IMCC14364 TaxID=3067902 RepID=UPI0027425519|nr:aminotransferase class IV [Parvularcula sp. IMCC14364]